MRRVPGESAIAGIVVSEWRARPCGRINVINLLPGRLDGEYAFGPGTQRTTSITVNLAASAEAAREQRNPDTRLQGHYHIATTDRVGLQPEYTGRRCR